MPICKRCGEEFEHVSKRGLCMDCAYGAVREAAIQMMEHKGPIYEKAHARLLAAMNQRRKKNKEDT